MGLLPGCAFYKEDDAAAVRYAMRNLKQFGFPLHLFGQNLKGGVAFIPMIALSEIDQLNECQGFLIGTTNQLFLNYPKLKADVVIDLDKGSLTYPLSETSKGLSEFQMARQKGIRQHSSYEKKLFKPFMDEKATQEKA